MKILLIVAILAIVAWEVLKKIIIQLTNLAIMIYNATPMGEKSLAIKEECKAKYWNEMCREIKD